MHHSVDQKIKGRALHRAKILKGQFDGRMLENLRANIGGLLHVALSSWYEKFRQNDPVLKNYPFGDYVGYLLKAGLIRSIETEQDGRKYIITDLGTDFLNYIEKSHYPKLKQH